MKQMKHLLGMAAALFFAACASDEPVDPVNPVVDHDQTRYLSVAISSPAGTRAAFEDYTNGGDPMESDVKNVDLIFYDVNKKFMMHSTIDVSKLNTTKNPDQSNITKILSQVIEMPLVQGQNLPAYVMAFVNARDLQSVISDDLDKLTFATRDYLKNTDGTFIMSNSVYFGEDPFSPGETVKIMATPIMDTQLFNDKTTAQNAIDNNLAGVINIYVERYAAKIGLELANQTFTYPSDTGAKLVDVDGKNVSLTFQPKAWRPNAISTKTYVGKTFATSANNNLQEAEFSAINAKFANSGMPDWNDPNDHRSFWGCSPSYHAALYPNVSDDVNDPTKTSTTLHYFSYQEVMNGTTIGGVEFDAGKPWNNGFAANVYFYSRETTTNLDYIKGNGGENENGEQITINSPATVASAVIVGQYSATIEGGETLEFTNGTSFYIHGETFYKNEEEAKGELIKRQRFIVNNALEPSTDEDIFVLEHPNAEVRGKVSLAGRYVTLQLTEASIAGKNIQYYGTKEDGEKGYVAVTGENLNEVNKLLWQSLGCIEQYFEGKAFFSIPIQHGGFPRDKVDAKGEELIDENGAYKWANMRIGDFGVVRNHVYNIKVSSIKGLGTGLRSNDQPIVPPKNEMKYYVAASLNVLAWNVVSEQNVEL